MEYYLVYCVECKTFVMKVPIPDGIQLTAKDVRTTCKKCRSTKMEIKKNVKPFIGARRLTPGELLF